MIFLFIFVILIKATCVTSDSVGSTLFYNRNARECWNEDDLARLRARRIFENIALPQVTPEKVTTKYIKATLKYFHRALRSVDNDMDSHTATILKEALYDTIGGHMRSELLPTVRFAYYAGYVPYRNVRHLHSFLDNIKRFLNTQGLGWKDPLKMPLRSNLTVGKILIGSGKLFDPCSCLVTRRDSNQCIHLPPPKLDDEMNPTAISLPFKNGALFSLTSPKSENVLLKYYTTAARCILRSSPEKCRHTDFVNFNNELWHWMKRSVAPHLMDEQLYAAYGGVLRIAAAVQNYGKGLSRRNLFDNEYLGETKWHPWSALTRSYVYVNTDWTPELYVGLVISVALAICLLQICYTYVFGQCNCQCAGGRPSKKSCGSREVVYANVDSHFPAVLPSHDTSVSTSDKRDKPLKVKSSSVGTFRTQRVYDLNDNMEKYMSVIMSDNEGSAVGTSSTDSKQSDEEDQDKTPVELSSNQTKRPKSPPEIETSIAQLKIDKTPRERRVPLYSTSTVTRSEVTYRQERVSDTAWSGSSTSGRTASSASSKTPSRSSRRSRDLAWARRVASKQSTKSTTGTDLDLNSFTTPPSRR